MKIFVEFHVRTEHNYYYYSIDKMMIAVDDIMRVRSCAEDKGYTILVTSDGQEHKVIGKYRKVVEKIRLALEINNA